MDRLTDSFKESLYEGFIDRIKYQKGKYKPKLLVNEPDENKNVLDTMLEQLGECNSFLFAVAFITESGLATLKAKLYDLAQKGIKGRILTSTFLQFNSPKVFRELLKLSHVEVRLAEVKGFHSKGYLFEHDNYHSFIVGSSNLTAAALKQNHEWNVKLNSLDNGDIVHHFLNQFENMWDKAIPLSEQWIDTYENKYKDQLIKSRDLIFTPDISYDVNHAKKSLEIKPNDMQAAALESLKEMRDKGVTKALVISATGTGKTYLSAFDVRRFRPKKMLFIAHRERILNQAKEDYHRVLGGLSNDFGLLTGQFKEYDKKYLFSSIMTLARDDILHQFDPEEFDYILIDEVHRAGAASYLKVIDYFKPKFFLGMTATPERTDDFNIYKIFDYHIAYEIRLQEALEEDMLCPFHYFGVTEFEYDGEVISDTTKLSQLVTKERVDHLIDKLNYYGHSGEEVKGLIFCSRKEEAKRLSEELNKRNYRTVALTGDDNESEREKQIDRLENGSLDYILTVDILNEGIDIPSLNQVVMLRQTESSIVFVQQLGRGLRKHPSKDFLTVIDFIGNYKNNYLIPVALSGDQSRNKDSLRRRTKEMTFIKGVSSVNFEEVARKRIFESINRTNLTTLTILREAYVNLENKIGRMPYLFDFIEHHSIDPQVIIEKHNNYYSFLKKISKEVPHLSEYEESVLTMLSAEVLNGKRMQELVLIRSLLNQGEIRKEQFIKQLRDQGCLVNDKVIRSVISVFDLSFFTKQNVEKYGGKPIVEEINGLLRLNSKIQDSLQNNDFFKVLIEDIIYCAVENSREYNCENSFTLFKKYTRKEVCKHLNWEKDESSTLFGYKTKHGTCPIFITYHKDETIDQSVQYEDELLSRDILRWFTRSNRTLESKEVQTIIEAETNQTDLHIFIKKDDDEGTEFYYLGEAHPDKSSVQQRKMLNNKGKELPVVEMELLLENPVERQLYNYLIHD